MLLDAILHLKPLERSAIQCSFDDEYDSVLWYQSTEEQAILTYRNSIKEGTGYESGEFDINPNGSLVILNVSLKHETFFTVKKIISAESPVIFNVYIIDVKTTGKPTYGFPIIDVCEKEHAICYKSIKDISSLNCLVNNSRPAVKLNWIDKTTVENVSISSPLTVSTTDNVTFTTILNVSPSVCDSRLCLLACKSSTFSWILQRDESLILLEDTDRELASAEPHLRFIEIDSEMTLNCGDQNTSLRVWKRNNGIDDTMETLAICVNVEKYMSTVLTNEFIITSDGSLSAKEAKSRAEGNYYCTYETNNKERVILYDIRIYSNPIPNYLVVDGCSNQQYCTLPVQAEGNVSCTLYGIRPEVSLEWEANQSDGISFTAHERKTEDKGDAFNIFLTSKFTISQSSESRITVKCRVTGEMANFFDLSTNIDLLVLKETNEVHTPTVVILIPAIAVIALLVVTAVLIWKRKALIDQFCILNGRETTKPSTRSRGEGINLMKPEATMDEKFIKELTTKYEMMYDAVRPIPYIRDKMYCVDKVYIEGGIKRREYIKDEPGKYIWTTLNSYNDILSESNLKSTRKIIEGEPGYGKSTITLQWAFDWCNRVAVSPLKNTDILVFLQLRQLGHISSIFAAIKQLILPKDSEFTETEKIRLTGFDDASRENYIRKAVVGNNEKAFEWIKLKLKENPILHDLCQVPLLFVMFAHLAHEEEDFKDFKSVTSFFRYAISCFHNHMLNKLNKNSSTADVFESNHEELNKIAFEGLSKPKPEIVWQKMDISNRLGKEVYAHYCDIGILVEEEVLRVGDRAGPRHAQYLTEVRFYHKLFCEWYAAHEFVRTVNSNPGILPDFFKNTEATEVEYMYRFACGINDKAAVNIIEHMEKREDCKKFAILCTVEQQGDIQNILKVVKRLVSKAIFLKEDSSRILQRSVMQLIAIASKNKIQVNEVQLQNVFSHVDTDRNNIVLDSGLSLPAMKTLRTLVINERGREMTVEEGANIISFALQSECLKKIDFEGCILPQELSLNDTVVVQLSSGCEVMWGRNCRLNLVTGIWEKDGKLLNDYEYKLRRDATLELYRLSLVYLGIIILRMLYKDHRVAA
ncbi:hypothetical protein BSL78_20177 [Apostichopus japonicus]|uniref:Ig-like domain-containing protein n=1 Tax=Stichopus japonicus TaxID=307972 RepID=A0A2G8K4M5_STIJA|nr:hypothetical protein BSL78_20177 [Apostichopus japonicus]